MQRGTVKGQHAPDFVAIWLARPEFFANAGLTDHKYHRISSSYYTSGGLAVLRPKAGITIGIAIMAACAAVPVMSVHAQTTGSGANANVVKSGVEAWQRQDFAGAVRQWEAAAARGDADAEFNLGQAYRLGKGVPQDMAKAEFYFGRAARKGHPQAGDNYGIVLFQSGRQTEALPWLNTAADRGEPRAMYILGIAAFNGDYVGKDWVRAYALMTRAAASGLPQATTSLATMDTVIPLEQRQMGISLAGDLERKAEQARSVQLAASDLGAKAPALPTPGSAAPRPLPTTSIPASTVATAPATPMPPRPVAPRPAPPPPAAARPPAPAPHATGNWRIQLGAFSQRGNADALWSRVKARPGVAGHPRIDIPSGGVTRLLAGGYAGQADAERACDGLKAGGIACLVIKP
ncbi:hypothetical protein NMD1_02403 [Novosphingobium sp. MD-1]|nr:hypothetical protein NMD1_02403 [Novosphingobium sp. MD-1]